MNDYFARRASVRKYAPDKIPSVQIKKIIETAMRAPTCGNMQLYSVIVTRDKEAKKQLAQLHFNQPAAVNADVILTVCADFNLFTRWCKLSNADPGYENFHSFIMAFTDAVIFAQQIVTIAEMEGLGTCYLGTVNYNASQISELLQLPDLVVPVAAISLGVPEEIPSQTDRLPVEAILHEEMYRKDSDNKVKEYFNNKENLEENKNFVKENDKNSLASVFTDIRYPKSTNEAVSKSFKSLIEEKKFSIP